MLCLPRQALGFCATFAMQYYYYCYYCQAMGTAPAGSKLDVQAAFDTLSHEAVARFLASLGAHQESKLLLDIIIRSKVTLTFANMTWEQGLKRGVLQGSAFSAELFARTLDFYVAPKPMRMASCCWPRAQASSSACSMVYRTHLKQ